MASKKGGKNRKKRGRVSIIAFCALLALFGLLFGTAAIRANTVYVMRAEVYVEDLPPAFEGRTILYASDIDLCGLNNARKAGALFESLRSLSPDLLILGGDYASPSVFEILNRTGSSRDNAREQRERVAFIESLRDFPAPLGKYAILSPDDGDPALLSDAMANAGIGLLYNDAVPVAGDGGGLWLIGVCGDNSGVSALSGKLRREDCVVAVAYSPSCFPQLMTLEADGGGKCVDLALAGHTHGGQLRLFGQNAIQLTSQERQYLYGWSREANVPMLTTSGVGCEGANLRIGSQAEVWLIKLTSRSPVELPDLR